MADSNKPTVVLVEGAFTSHPGEVAELILREAR
jgi:hypothetical protein